MALSREDHHDVSNALGKALAKKVSKATRDGGPKISSHFADLPAKARVKRLKDGTMAGDASRVGRGMRELGEGKYVKLKPTQSRWGEGRSNLTAFSPYKPSNEEFNKKYNKGTKQDPEKYTRAGDKKFTTSKGT